MIILDTNLISELMRDAPDPVVLAWIDSLIASDVFTTSVSKAEILYGLALLPHGRRRNALTASADFMLSRSLVDRILPFDSAAATFFADLVINRRTAGRPVAFADAQIASIARSTGGIVATRNVADFENCGIELINPWPSPNQRAFS